LNRPKRILVAVLNWGLGHASRCVPIIQALQERGMEVFIASDGDALALLEKEFPTLPNLQLPSYKISYPTDNMFWNMGIQLPNLLSAFRAEHKAIETFVKPYDIDIILSDNRYGCYHPECKNIFLTHQLKIKIPNSLLQKAVARINRKLISRFDECWVPDWEGYDNISGELSDATFFSKVRFIGLLSRMQYLDRPKKREVIVVLSGPEPQRTYLEKVIIEQAKELKAYQFLIVCGRMQEGDLIRLSPNVEQVLYLTSVALNEAIAESEIVICRAGYSSIMDLVKLKKPAILIPTTGQTEQEYLAQLFFEKGIFYTQDQSSLDLAKALKEVEKYKGFHQTTIDETLLAKAIKILLT